eukprot:2663894-Pyramimonas_sp.AAC.1
MQQRMCGTHAGGPAWWLRWSPLWGHETLYPMGENAKLGFWAHADGGIAGLPWSSLWGHWGISCFGTHADGGTGAFGGAP